MGAADSVEIKPIDVDGPLWAELLEHLERVGQRRHAFEPDGSLFADAHFIGRVQAGRIIGNVGLRVRPLALPETLTSNGLDHLLRAADGTPLRELYVETFAVEPEHRRRGYGRALQFAALSLARQLGCYQLRSWSTVDRYENYALKLSLGFAAHPAIHHSTTTGLEYSGVYFIKTID